MNSNRFRSLNARIELFLCQCADSISDRALRPAAQHGTDILLSDVPCCLPVLELQHQCRVYVHPLDAVRSACRAVCRSNSATRGSHVHTACISVSSCSPHRTTSASAGQARPLLIPEQPQNTRNVTQGHPPRPHPFACLPLPGSSSPIYHSSRVSTPCGWMAQGCAD